MTDDDRARLDVLRARVYRPGATDADRSAYAEEVERLAGPPPIRAPIVPSAVAPHDERVGRARSVRVRVLAGLMLVLGLAITAVVVISGAAAPSLGPLRGRSIPLKALGTSAVRDALPGPADTTETARLFDSVPATPAERTTAARRPFFASGSGRTDFDLRGFDIGASTFSVTVVTDVSATVEVVLATENRRDVLGESVVGIGRADEWRPIAGWSTFDGRDTPRVLRVTVPSGTRFLVRAVFLTSVDPGTLGP